MRFKSKISTMGKRRIIEVPKCIRDEIEVGTEVEVEFDDKE